MKTIINNFFLALSLLIGTNVYSCEIRELNPNAVSPDDTVLIEIVTDFVNCGNYSRAGFIEPVGYDTLYFDEFEIINDTLATVLIIFPSDLPYSIVEFFICNTEYWDNRQDTWLTIGSITTVYEPELCMVTVDSINKNMIIWNIPTLETIDSVIIYKELLQNDNFVEIATVNVQNHYYIDGSSIPSQNSDRYQIEMIDHNNVETLKSDIHKTIHLSINAGLGGVWNLAWDDYSGFDYSSFKILRGTSDGVITELAEIPKSIKTYSDLNPPAETKLYIIEVENPSPCIIDNSKSLQDVYRTTSSNVVYTNITSVNDYKSSDDFSVIFSSEDNQLSVISKKMIEKHVLRIFTVDGKIIENKSINELKMIIDLNYLKSGLYIVSVGNNINSINKKIIVK